MGTQAIREKPLSRAPMLEIQAGILGLSWISFVFHGVYCLGPTLPLPFPFPSPLSPSSFLLPRAFVLKPRRSCTMPAAHRPPPLQPLRKPPTKLRSLPTPLRIEQSEHVQPVNLVVEESPASALSDQSEADSIQPPNPKPRPLRNQKKLSLNLSAHSNASSTSLNIPESPVSVAPAAPSAATAAHRRPSIVSLPNGNVMAHRRDEEASPSAPYIDGPIEILPGIWIGSEDNARNWKCLVERGIRSILNVAKEVTSPYVPANEAPLRSTVSTPNLAVKFSDTAKHATYVPPHLPSGRPAMHYLRLPWSHGQTDLVHTGFVQGMAFVDQARERGDGVLIQ